MILFEDSTSKGSDGQYHNVKKYLTGRLKFDKSTLDGRVHAMVEVVHRYDDRDDKEFRSWRVAYAEDLRALGIEDEVLTVQGRGECRSLLNLQIT